MTDSATFFPYRTSLALLQAVMQVHPENFAYKQPPYEYEYERLPMDLILGSRELREALETGIPIAKLEAWWLPALEDFMKKRERYLLYR